MSCLALFLLASRVSLKGMLLQIWSIHEAVPPWKCLSLFNQDSGKTTPQKIPLLLFSATSSHPSFWHIFSCILVDGGSVFFLQLCVFERLEVCENLLLLFLLLQRWKSRLREFSVPSQEASDPNSSVTKQIFFSHFDFSVLLLEGFGNQ